MKTNRTVSINIEVWAAAKNAYPNMSKKIESLLRASIDLPNNEKSSDTNKRSLQIKEESSALKTKLNELTVESNKLKDKVEKEKTRWVEI